MAAKTYDSTAVIITIAGLVMSGFRDGDKVTIAKDGDLWNKTIGVDGEPTRSRNNQGDGGTITLGLQYGSGAGLELEVLKRLDLIGGTGTFPIIIVDVLGGSTAVGLGCWIKKEADITIAGTVGDSEWIFDCPVLNLAHGVLL